MTNPDRKILILWVIAIAMITMDEIRSGQPMPRPWRYTGSAVVYGLAGVVSEVTGDFAVALAAGWTIAIFFKALGNKGTTKAPAATGTTAKTTTGGK
jgi:hypothetical protein